MKHENATSVDNAKIAATIRHTLTFEEVYAMTYVRESIECLLDQNLRQYPVLNGYKDDLRQEILIRLNNELPVFDPEKSSFNTFSAECCMLRCTMHAKCISEIKT